MKPLYKYLSDREFIERFLEHGEVMFSALSYFRDYEYDSFRGDEYEGTCVFDPVGGLQITVVDTGEQLSLPYAFDSQVREQDIFVFCCSTKLSAELAEQFGAVGCIEIHNPAKFFARIKRALSLRSSVKDKTLLCGDVIYYSDAATKPVEWALPERIVMMKREQYSFQKEYRLAFAVNDAWEMNSTSHYLRRGLKKNNRLSEHQRKLLKLGNLRDIARVCEELS